MLPVPGSRARPGGRVPGVTAKARVNPGGATRALRTCGVWVAMGICRGKVIGLAYATPKAPLGITEITSGAETVPPKPLARSTVKL